MSPGRRDENGRERTASRAKATVRKRSGESRDNDCQKVAQSAQNGAAAAHHGPSPPAYYIIPTRHPRPSLGSPDASGHTRDAHVPCEALRRRQQSATPTATTQVLAIIDTPLSRAQHAEMATDTRPAIPNIEGAGGLNPEGLIESAG